MSRHIKFCLTIVITLIFILSKLPDSTALSTGVGNRIVLIRHGEKGPQDLHHDVRPKQHTRTAGERTPSGEDGRRKFPSGLNDAGRSRAQYIRTLFGNHSEFDFGLIFAAPRDMPVETERTYATVAPLARDLELEVIIKCANNGPQCILREVQNFRRDSNKDILIAWKHRDLNHIATMLGAENARQSYPDERYDIVWIMQDRAIIEKRSMHCPILDDDRVDEGDPDLEVESLQYSWWWSVISRWVGVLAGFTGAGANIHR